MATPTDEGWDKYDTSKEFREFMEITKHVNGDEDKKNDKPKEWAGAYFARWLNYEKFSSNEDRKLPQIAKEAEELSGKVGIRKDFLSEETKQLINSIEVYVKALQKRGI